jgi:hypothetical protein
MNKQSGSDVADGEAIEEATANGQVDSVGGGNVSVEYNPTASLSAASRIVRKPSGIRRVILAY